MTHRPAAAPFFPQSTFTPCRVPRLPLAARHGNHVPDVPTAPPEAWLFTPCLPLARTYPLPPSATPCLTISPCHGNPSAPLGQGACAQCLPQPHGLQLMWTSTPAIHPHLHISDFWSDYSGSCAPSKQLGILIPRFLFILFRQWKCVFCFVA
jgi:hypothetical protein